MLDNLCNPLDTEQKVFVSKESSGNKFFGLLTRSRLVLAAQISDFAVIVIIAMLVVW